MTAAHEPLITPGELDNFIRASATDSAKNLKLPDSLKGICQYKQMLKDFVSVVVHAVPYLNITIPFVDVNLADKVTQWLDNWIDERCKNT